MATNPTFETRQPRDLGGMFSGTFDAWGRAPKVFLGSAFLVSTVLVLVSLIPLRLIFGIWPGETPTASSVSFGGAFFAGLGFLLVGIVLGLVGQAIISGVHARAVAQLGDGEQPELSASLSSAMPYVLRLVLLSVAIGALLLLMSITIIGIPFAVWLGVRWSIAAPALVLEDTGVGAAMSRSSELVKGNWWRIVGISLLIGITVEIATVIFSAILNGLIGGPVMALLVDIATRSVGGSVSALVATLFFFDLRARHGQPFGTDEGDTGAGYSTELPTY